MSMHSYIAFLGHQPLLGIAELSALLPDFSLTKQESHFILFQTKTDLSQEFLDRLGSIVLLGKRIIESDITLTDIPQILATELEGVKGKAVFGFRFLHLPPKKAEPLYRQTKQLLKERGLASRYIGNASEPAKPIQLHDEDLLNPASGCELIIAQDKDALWVGRTIAAQNVKRYTARDMEKPVRDTSVGLLPPKLAQTLLNFGHFLVSEQKKDAHKKQLSIFDPFCGTGVILLEALLCGMSVFASDVSEKAVKGATTNIEWLRKAYKIFKKDAESSVWKQNACTAFAFDTPPDMIVSEGTLGPALKERPTVRDAELLRKDADELTAAFLQNTAKTLKGVPIVLTLPVWYAQKRMIWLQNVWKAIDACGYTAVLPPSIEPSMEDRPSLLYRRPEQFVGREIVLLLPKKK